MGISIGFVGAGQFAGSFMNLFRLHPDVDQICVTDLIPERAEKLRSRYGLERTYADYAELLASDCDAVAIFTQRWTHGPLVVQALQAGKHVYSAVPMAISTEEIESILSWVKETGLIYMMGETSYYNPAVVYARQKIAEGAWGRIFYSEGDYVHDMDDGFYAAYQYSGGAEWKSQASFPPMLYPTHAVGGVLGAVPTHAVSVSCIGVTDDRGDARVHDRTRLPASFDGAPNGHEGSHHFLADDFVRAVSTRTQPPLNAWTAARLTLPGIVALESARQGGQRCAIPDFGDPS